MTTDWKTHLDLRVKAKLCNELGLGPLLQKLRSPEAAHLRIKLGAEHLFDLEQGVKACECIQELTEVWEELHCQSHPPEADTDVDNEGDKWKTT